MGHEGALGASEWESGGENVSEESAVRVFVVVWVESGKLLERRA